MTPKEEFLAIFQENVSREGAAELAAWLETTDFFTAPASTRYHCACEGGLVLHSLSVYHTLMERYFEEGVDSRESFAIVALLHDLCKANYYKVSTRNVKNDETGVWEKVPYYEFDDNLPYGHGEKSVYIIGGFMRLTREEAFAIRYHMGFAEEKDIRNCSKAFEMFPLAFALATADMEASLYLEEKR